MLKNISLKLKPHEAVNEDTIRHYISVLAGKNESDITGFYILKKSIDARSRQQTWVNLTLKAFINEPYQQRLIQQIAFKDVTKASNKVIIVGAGPAGLFAALKLLELGIKPIILERGKNVQSRRRDLAILNKQGIVNPESNYCFGEGGAGAYSDGKLYTRSTKRGDVNRILNLFVQFGAAENILYEAHPHIGTNKLPQIITTIRDTLIQHGAEVLFEKKVIDFIIEKDTLKGVKTEDGKTFKANAVILATGHSARDIFELLHHKNILIEAKPFALGVRIEHPQSIINAAQYHYTFRENELPPASYNLVEQINGRGVFSFCMCPGGIIAPAATNPNEVVVNGWSPSKRNNFFANSGIVVSVALKDALQYLKANKNQHNSKQNPKVCTTPSPLTLMHFQQIIEQHTFAAGGGKLVAPALRMVDFCTNKISSSLPSCSYLPGIIPADFKNVLPFFIHKNVQEGLKAFGKKIKGYYTNEAVVVATESRTSSPVRIPRQSDTLQHPQIKNLYPCAEGSGYAGGIVSAAMDGEKVATTIAAMVGV